MREDCIRSLWGVNIDLSDICIMMYFHSRGHHWIEPTCEQWTSTCVTCAWSCRRRTRTWTTRTWWTKKPFSAPSTSRPWLLMTASDCCRFPPLPQVRKPTPLLTATLCPGDKQRPTLSLTDSPVPGNKQRYTPLKTPPLKTQITDIYLHPYSDTDTATQNSDNRHIPTPLLPHRLSHSNTR